MAVTCNWKLYDNEPPFAVRVDNIPYLPLNLTNDIQVFSLKFQGTEIEYLELFLEDEIADIYYSDDDPEFRVNLITKDDIEIYLARFNVVNVKIFTSEDVGTDFSGVVYDNGPTDNGIGATLTAVGNGKFTHNGADIFAVNDVILVKNQTNQFQNGVYRITVFGNSTTKWVLTRESNANTGKKLKEIVVVSDESSLVARKVDQENPSINGSAAITFETTITDVDELNDSLYWVNILQRTNSGTGPMLRFTVNSSSLNRTLTLGQKFEAESYKIALKVVRTNNTFDHFQIRNLRLLSQFKTQLPENAPRPVRIFSEEDGFSLITQSQQIEYYLPTSTTDFVTYKVINKTWLPEDVVEVYRQPLGGIRSLVSSTQYTVSAATGNIIFFMAMNNTDVITVTIIRSTR